MGIIGTIFSVLTFLFVAFGGYMLHRGLEAGGDSAMAWVLGTMGAAPGILTGLAAGLLFRACHQGKEPAVSRLRSALGWLPLAATLAMLAALGLILT